MSLIPQLPDFIFTEKLGKGSYATVYKAYRKDKVREVVAIKCIQKSSLTKSSVENILTEISIMKNVKHEYIVEMKDFQWDNSYIYIILEYCSGGDLYQFIRQKRRLPEAVAQNFLQQLATALKVLKSHNIAHMDLKPQNILLSSRHNPVLKLGDFGFAQYLQPESEGSSLRGSPLYMAPEILLKHHYDARVDLWSTGIILYECLFGQAPFSSSTFTELAEKIKSSKPVELPIGAQVSDECRSLLLGLLQRDPDKRITFDAFFDHPFVDLEHMPTPESYTKGVTLVQKAVQADADGNFESALKLYSQSLEYLVPHVSKEADRTKREQLRRKLLEYINKAEKLKGILKINNKSETAKADPKKNKLTEVGQLLYNKPDLQQALCLALEADSLVNRNFLEEASLLYQQALEIMIPAVSKEPPGKTRELLYVEVDGWMRKAEDLKTYMKATKQHKKLSDSIATGTDAVHFNTLSESIATGCILQ